MTMSPKRKRRYRYELILFNVFAGYSHVRYRVFEIIESLRWSHLVPPDGSSSMRCWVARSFGGCSVACSLWHVPSAYYLTEYYCFLYVCRRPFLSPHFTV
jgi:hypothetical protein